jgi:tetratricopeptide (TPR) repeat protein
VSILERLLQERIIREAEGYLDLATAFADLWELSPAVRDRLAQRALKALGRLDDCVQAEPYVSYLRGQTLRTMERYEDAIKPLREVADLEPENIHAYLALGWCYKRIGNLDLAIESLEDALAVDPKQAIIHYNLACYWSLSGNTNLALAYLASALEIDASYLDLVAKESDFDPIRDHPSFQELTSVIV